MRNAIMSGGNAARYRRSHEAGAALTTPPLPGARNAAAGLPTIVDDQGRIWAQNGSALQLLYEVQSGDSLSRIASAMYGNAARLTEIRNVPQNRALQGPDMNTGLFPGDIILIPNLTAPAVAPTPQTPPSAPQTIPGVSPPAPQAGPLTVPQPVTPGLPAPSLPGGQPAPTFVGPVGPTTATTKKKFWTPAKVGIAAIAGAGAIGTLIYMMSKPKRRRR